MVEGWLEQLMAGVDGVGELVVGDGTAFHMGSMMTELEDLKMETLTMSGSSKSYPVLANLYIPIIIVGKAVTPAGGVLGKGRWSSSGGGRIGEATDRCTRGKSKRGRCTRGRRHRSKTCGCNCKVVRGQWWIKRKAQRAQCLI